MESAPVASDNVPTGVLFHGENAALGDLHAFLKEAGVERRLFEELARDPAVVEQIAVLLADSALLERITSLPELPEHLVVVAADVETEAWLGGEATLSMAGITDPSARMLALRAAFQLSSARAESRRARAELAHTRSEVTELNRIGLSLMLEHDPDVLLREILNRARQLTRSDTGALFLVETDQAGNQFLRFKLVQSDSLPEAQSLEQEVRPLDASTLIGYAAQSGRPIVMEDAHRLPADAPYVLNEDYDRLFGYHRKSLVTVPMIDHLNRVVGVLQLANRKRRPEARIGSPEDVESVVIPYSEWDIQLAFSLAGQAAVSIENNKLYGQVEQLLDCFVKASVTAIDERDPTTAGHSIRVSTLTMDLARALERSGARGFRDLNWTRDQLRELRFAALLHDFGKVAVREEVLIKAKKLPPVLWERVSGRFDLIRMAMQSQFEKKRMELATTGTSNGPVAQLSADFAQQMRQLDRFEQVVRAANEPTLLSDQNRNQFESLAEQTFVGPDGIEEQFLTQEELHYLRIPKGSLDGRERREVESHVEATVRFLEQIPWTPSLQNISRFAYGHHEKLNGTGYPRGLSADAIPLQTRILTVADIFDALTEADRPYKKAVTAEHALDILRAEAAEGAIDSEIVRILIESQSYLPLIEKDWREL